MNAAQQIIACLQRNPLSTSGFIAYSTQLNYVTVVRELNELMALGTVSMDVDRVTAPTTSRVFGFPPRMLYSLTAETIGECEVCGAVDHHLVHGICPLCRAKAVTMLPVLDGVAI